MKGIIDLFFNNFWPIVTTILMGCLVAHLTWRTGYKTRRADASTSFRNTFLTELGSVYPVVNEWPQSMHKFLMPKFPIFQAAVNNFRPHVHFWKRRSFDEAWLRFHNSAPEESSKPAFVHYSSATYDQDITHSQAVKECQLRFYHDVKHLLSFANET